MEETPLTLTLTDLPEATVKEIAKDRLVIMVTHNPELAEKYATRTVRLLDGRVTDDSAPFDAEAEAKAQERPPKRLTARRSARRKSARSRIP